jgi:cytochrome c553
MRSLSLITPIAFFFLVGLSFSAAAREDAWQQREDNAAWRSECSACHIAFPPTLLAVDDWVTIMAHLDKHYGAEASLDAATRDEIGAYLARNGRGSPIGISVGNGTELPRITRSDWFLRKHGSAVRLWRKGKVKSLADCAACHKGPDIEKMTGG